MSKSELLQALSNAVEKCRGELDQCAFVTALVCSALLIGRQPSFLTISLGSLIVLDRLLMRKKRNERYKFLDLEVEKYKYRNYGELTDLLIHDMATPLMLIRYAHEYTGNEGSKIEIEEKVKATIAENCDNVSAIIDDYRKYLQGFKREKWFNTTIDLFVTLSDLSFVLQKIYSGSVKIKINSNVNGSFIRIPLSAFASAFLLLVSSMTKNSLSRIGVKFIYENETHAAFHIWFHSEKYKPKKQDEEHEAPSSRCDYKDDVDFKLAKRIFERYGGTVAEVSNAHDGVEFKFQFRLPLKEGEKNE